jgi:LacI family transcriptional regulator
MSSRSQDEPVLPGPEPGTITIHDVARAAGVTISTVSKALNGQGKIRAETRTRIQEEARRLGFRPNDLAQSLMRGRTRTIGLITADQEGRFSIPLLSGINDALNQAQISVFLCDTRDDASRERQHIDSILAKRVEGIIVTGWRTDPRPPLDLGKSSIPVVYAYTQIAQGDALCLLPDDEQGGWIATDRLLRAGRKHFAHITGPFRFEAVRLREKGMRRALAEYGVPYLEQNVLSGPWREKWGREAVTMLLERKQAIDAIFCGDDLIARGVLDALREHGVKVPDDIAVIGFDNWVTMDVECRPPLSSVDMNIHALGRQAGEHLLAMIDKPADQRETGILRLPCNLIVRNSCGTGPQELQDELPLNY